MPASSIRAAARHPAFRRERPLVFAHRGGRAYRPENTMIAFAHGLACGADGLEMDVHLASDGEVVVCHDATLDRTTDATGPVAGRTSAELAAVDAGCRFGDAGRLPFRGQHVGVPRLRDVLARFRGTRAIVEMKRDDPAMADAVVAIVRDLNLVDTVCLGSFGAMVLGRVRQLAPEIATSGSRREVRVALYRSWIRWPARHVAYQAHLVPEATGGHRVVTPRFVRDAHRAGVVVHVWTVNEEADMRRLLDWGVDGLITDVPDAAVRVRDAWWAERGTTK